MVGFYGGAPLEYAGLTEQGSDAVPAATGEVLGAAFGEGLAHNLTPRLFRQIRRTAAESDVFATDPMMGFPIQPEALIDPETANAEFGIKGALSFDKPVSRTVAKDLHDHKREQIERDDAIARREGGLLTGGAARFTTSLAAGVLDPINLAVGFIPVVGPAREAALIAQAGSAAARAGVRAGLGGAQGAAAIAALQPLEFALSRQEREDYTMADALRSIALGTVLGGGLHAGTGALLDRATGRYRNPLTQRIEDAGPEARETALQGALAQSIDGRPVEVAAVFDGAEAARAGDATRLRSASDDMLAAARREDVPPMRDEAMPRQSDTLADINTQIAELERLAGEEPQAGRTPAGEAPGTFRTVIEKDGERSVIEGPTDALRARDPAEAAEARASAIERAAFCISRA